MQSIELDCAPGSPRPGDLIMSVVAGTPAEPLSTPENAVSRVFGEWTWEYDIDRETWERDVQPVVKARIIALYNSGSIRYGGW